MEGDLADPDALRRGYTMEELVAFAAEHGQPSFLRLVRRGNGPTATPGTSCLGSLIEKR